MLILPSGTTSPRISLLLAEDGQVINSDDRWYYLGKAIPPTGCRSARPGRPSSSGTGETETAWWGSSTASWPFPKPIRGRHMHQGETYLVEDLALEEKSPTSGRWMWTTPW